MKLVTIKRRTTNINGDQVGTYDKQPFINTIMYNAEFRDGVIRNYGVNIIAQNLYSQVDEQGHSYCLLDSIIELK